MECSITANYPLTETLIRRTMDNLKNKLTNQAESQPSCLGAVMPPFIL
jgi:hypothetical protein